jgi:hypothetical protein
VAAPEPSRQGGSIQSRGTRDAPEPSLARKQNPELYDIWCIEVVPCRKAGSGAADT